MIEKHTLHTLHTDTHTLHTDVLWTERDREGDE